MSLQSELPGRSVRMAVSVSLPRNCQERKEREAGWGNCTIASFSSTGPVLVRVVEVEVIVLTVVKMYLKEVLVEVVVE